MSDIVERLRDRCMSDDWKVVVSEAHEAADEIEKLRAALREAASDFQMSLQIDKQKDAKIEQLTGALRGVVDDEPCWFDHHGYCQTHVLGNPCEMAIARAALEGK